MEKRYSCDFQQNSYATAIFPGVMDTSRGVDRTKGVTEIKTGNSKIATIRVPIHPPLRCHRYSSSLLGVSLQSMDFLRGYLKESSSLLERDNDLKISCEGC